MISIRGPTMSEISQPPLPTHGVACIAWHVPGSWRREEGASCVPCPIGPLAPSCHGHQEDAGGTQERSMVNSIVAMGGRAGVRV